MNTANQTEETAAVVQSPLPKRNWARAFKRNLVSYSFLLPIFIGILVFTLYPIIMSLIYAFSNFNGVKITKMGTFNFTRIFDLSPKGYGQEFLGSLKVTFIYVVANMVISLTLSYVLALFLRRNIPGMRIIRVLCYLPCLIPGIAAGLIWTNAFAANMADGAMNGLFNTWIIKLGGKPLSFFIEPSTSLPTLLFSGVWGIGGGMIMWLASFENISPDLYEAAKIDGAGYFRSLFSITVPMSTPILFYNAVTSMIGGLQVFGSYANYGTGVDDKCLHFIAIRIYTTALDGTRNIPGGYGLGCAMAWCLFVIIAVLTLIMFKTGNWVQYGDE